MDESDSILSAESDESGEDYSVHTTWPPVLDKDRVVESKISHTTTRKSGRDVTDNLLGLKRKRKKKMFNPVRRIHMYLNS